MSDEHIKGGRCWCGTSHRTWRISDDPFDEWTTNDHAVRRGREGHHYDPSLTHEQVMRDVVNCHLGRCSLKD